MKKLSIIILCFSLIFLCLAACSPQPAEDGTLPIVANKAALLGQSEDMGQNYIDSFIFIGESTTYHLKSRGVLSGGKNTTQVWGTSSGTLNLSLTIDKVKIVYPDTKEQLTFREAAAKKQPKYVFLCFGLNGAVQNIRQGEEYFKTCYKKLINAIRDGSPDTKIILSAAYPVAENMDMSNYSIDLDTLNSYIDTINSWTLSLAEEEGLRYLNTAEVLRDQKGRLRPEYQVGDGHHLTKEAYEVILRYIRTHGYS